MFSVVFKDLFLKSSQKIPWKKFVFNLYDLMSQRIPSLYIEHYLRLTNLYFRTKSAFPNHPLFILYFEFKGNWIGGNLFDAVCSIKDWIEKQNIDSMKEYASSLEKFLIN